MIRTISLVLLVAVATAAAALSGSGTAPARAAVHRSPNATTITVVPEQDAYVAKGITDPNPGGPLRVGFDNEADYLSFVQFRLPLEVMGEGAVVTHAELRMYCRSGDVDVGTTSSFEVGIAIRKWAESTINYTNKPNSTGPKTDWPVKECTDTWLSSNDNAEAGRTLAEAVQKWYDEETDNNGFVIGPSDTRTEKLFILQSREGYETVPIPISLAPKLVITFESGVTPTFIPSATRTASPTSTPTNTPTPTDTPTPTNTPTPTDTPTNTPTPSDTPTPTNTPTPGANYFPLALQNHDFNAVEPTPSSMNAPAAHADRPRPVPARSFRDHLRRFFGLTPRD